MPIRPTILRCRRAVAACLLVLPLAAPAAPPVPCPDSPPASLSLSVSSGVIHDGTESRLEVHVHADGCIVVHRPWYLRDAGDFELRLAAAEWAALQRTIATDELGKIDQERLSTQTAMVWKEAPTDAVVFADPDADVFTLHWHDGGRSRQLVARNPELAAARRPDDVSLNRVAGAIGALRALAARAGKRGGAEARP